MSDSGAARSPGTSRDLRAAARRRGVRVQMLPGRFRCRGIPPAGIRRVRRGAARGGDLRRTDDRARRGRARARAHPGRGRPRATTGFLASRPRGVENLAIAEAIEAARWTGCRLHILHLSSADALPMIRSARRDGLRADGRGLPALPDLQRRGDPRRSNAIQVLPADPGSRQPGRTVGRGRRRHHRLHRVRPFALHPGAQAARRRRLRGGLGRDLLAATGPAGDLDRGPPPRPCS